MPKEMIAQNTEIIDTREDDSESVLIEEIRERVNASMDHEYDERSEGVSDLEFKKGGDGQWTEDILQDRRSAKRPVLTINKLPVFTDQVIGDSRQNRIEIRITARNNSKKARDAAEIREGLIRNIQEQSDANFAYQTAEQGAIDSGRGVFSIEIIDSDENPFVRDLRIIRVPNPYSHYFDPRYHLSGLEKDRRYHIVTEMVDRKEFEARYPDKSAMQAPSGIADDGVDWVTKDHVRICDYWVKRPTEKKIYLLDDGRIVDGKKWDKIRDELAERERTVHADETGAIQEGPSPMGGPEIRLNKVPAILKEKTVKSYKILWYKVDGSQILDGPIEYPGRFIPHFPVWGKEIIIEGKRDVRGLIRNSRDPQRILNYEITAEMERTALAKIPPTDVTPKMIEGHEAMWNSDANLKYRLFNPDPKVQGAFPKQNNPPQLSGHTGLAAQANQMLHDTTGLQAPSLGRSSGSHVSGIKEGILMREGDVGTFEYHDNLVRAVKQAGRALNDLVSVIYDTKREEAILGLDGSKKYVTLNQKVLDRDTGEEVIINDMSIGQFDVAVTVGPSYTTQREETRSNLSDLARAVPMIAELGADMLVRNLDFVGTDELVERIRWRMILAGMIEPNDDEKERLVQKSQEMQQRAQADPENIRLGLKVQGQQFDTRRKEINLQAAVVELQRMVMEMNQTMKTVADGAATGAVTETLRKLGLIQEGTA